MHRTVTRSASALRSSASKLWGNFLQHLQSMLQDFDGVFFIISLRFDETPCKIKVEDEDSYKLPQGPEAPGKPTQAAQQLAKVLQTEVAIAALLRSKEADGKKHVLVSGYVPVPLQVLDRQTARNMTCALSDSMSLPGLLDAAEKFEFKSFLFCTDEYAANNLTEWALQAATPNFMKLATYCDIHKGSTCQGKVFDICGPAISAVINFALLTQHAGSVGKLQAILAEILSERFELKIGSPDEVSDAWAYRKAVFDLYLNIPDRFTEETADLVSTKSRLRIKQRQQRRIMLEHFLNGDIRDPNKVVHWAPAGAYSDKQAALAMFLKHVVPCLLPSSCPLFPRNRWFGSDLTLDFIGLLCSVHNLFGPLAQRWCGKPAAQNFAAPDNLDPLEDDGWDFMADIEGPEDQQRLAAVAEQIEAEDQEQQQPGDQNDPVAEGADASGPGLEAGAAQSTGFDWAAYHQRLRTSVCDWLRLSREQAGPSPQCQVSLMRQYMAPILKLMTFLLHISSKRFTRDQLEKEAAGQNREYRICKAFKGAEVSQLLQHVLRLMDTPPVGLLESDWRKDVSVLCFTMLSRLGCSVHQLFVWRCKKYPYRLFDVLDGNAREVFDTPRCLQDEITRRLCESCESAEAFCSDDMISIVRALATIAETDIGQIERQHASSRRTILTRVQARPMSLQSVSADFMIRHFVQRCTDAFSFQYFDCGSVLAKLKRRQRRSLKKRGTRKTIKKRRGGGGGFRAFLSIKTAGTKATPDSWRLAGAAWRGMTEQEKAYYKDIGEAATVTHRRGFRSFGKRRQKKMFLPQLDLWALRSMLLLLSLVTLQLHSLRLWCQFPALQICRSSIL
eukprot:Skav218631  [mRNA]  locus=scaffold365:169195:172418:+ [translate_table: standard]